MAKEAVATLPEAEVAASFVGVPTVEGIIGELGTLGPAISGGEAETVVRKWLLEAAQKAASEPKSAVTFEVLSGNLTVNKSTTIAGWVTIAAGETNLYRLARNAVITCGLTDVALRLIAQGCLKTLFGLAG